MSAPGTDWHFCAGPDNTVPVGDEGCPDYADCAEHFPGVVDEHLCGEIDDGGRHTHRCACGHRWW
jgi:hypothetical protein